ncbi:hypothetical protein ACFL3Q_03615 [Planctomycetota bacterium]
MEYTKSEKYIEARNSLSDELKPIYDEFVADYRFAATLRYGKPYVSYLMLADMVKAGWRPSTGPKK